MRIVAPPAINVERLEAYLASWARWLVLVLAWLAEGLKRCAPGMARIPVLHGISAAVRLAAARELRVGVAQLRLLVAGMALARMRGRMRFCRMRTVHPGCTRRCVRRARRRFMPFYRRIAAGLIRDAHAGSLRQRAERLAALIANPEPLIARVVKRIRLLLRGINGVQHALVVRQDARTSLAFAPLAAHADTS